MSGAFDGIELTGKLPALFVSSLLSACLLSSPPEPARYFRPDTMTPAASVVDDVKSAGSNASALRLRRVTAAAHLNERIVWRMSDVEFGFYDSRRWTELPAHYVEQLLSRELFELRGLRRATAGAVPTLRVELLAFDEVLTPEHEARIEVWVLLVDQDRIARLERTFTAAQPIAENDPVSFTRALGRALNDLVARVAAEVEAALQPSEG
jgi:ABC-type uncharacterized transport system auxiliary subunit